MSAELKRRSALAGNKVAQYERMIEIRTLEEQINALFASGEIRGTTHLCIGQEALAVGMASVLRPTDIVSATYRGHGIALALGLSPESVLGEIMGKTVGCCGGVGGSMHLSNMELGLLPTSAIIGGGMPVAAGAALSFQTRGTDDVAVAVFGDGATNIGAFHETLNLAAIWNLPIVFICDNNVYGEYSRIDITTPLEDLHLRGESYRMPHYAIDGMDIAAVQEGIQKAVDHARSGKGPTFIEAKTYRFSGHSRADLALYRPEGELEKWQARDPIKLTEEKLVKEKLIDAAQINKIKEETLKVIEGVVEVCKSAPNPTLASMFQNIYTDKKGK
ncbi:pyruvate dehydrogenase E1 component alpha subunit [Candidatus Planktophila versatilis]|jgi:pyruvate dehydrogenase E1 component alpha subunit|uniref:Pyruvate dehydrogenase E1 component alpha subunit n=1 Tax=Candidatus Planktophila versatilis TaxID=1884905 RepID=A0AAC9YWP6_9ACTN|nr:thiamine pyrophosphate-dependent dehydrogenase E1 component subunit alpha [Candidatus Planktophila versatilis]ASY17834.1 pyruvate dehydrogenase E1 component alpha subunit [Candidatus Planktophila versatilis]ASY19151.1 pyruvate dehydrogenase E1 component alpha subunit [Candidatus Planktophila versatilis]ASY23161.1 pyruvate dehydrogenase E1 component alpha subunit [Candidatus Planktophila versatilis]